MEKITQRAGRAMPVPGNDIDTDRIIPARYMKSVTFSGLGAFAFFDERYGENNSLKPHPFNDETYKGASILIVNKNFGCGSSREHAPQALKDYGITALVGESFAEIFAGNCTAMGMPVVTVSEKEIAEIQKLVEQNPRIEVKIDLEQMVLKTGEYSSPVTMPETYRRALLDGSWDSTSLLLQASASIEAIEKSLHYRFSTE
jgi:3-isopropylmalate/(R)-2-methylmalate dehydratase small subunit